MNSNAGKTVRIGHASDLELLDSVIGAISDSYQKGENDVVDEKYEGFKQTVRSSLLSSDDNTAGAYAHRGDGSVDFVIRDGELKEYRGHQAKVVIPDNVVIIGERAFRNNRDLVEVIMDSSVRMISDSAFYGCTALRTVFFSDEIYFLGNRAFSDCTSLTAVTLPTELMYAGKLAFSGCRNLRQLTINSKLKIIEEGMFLYCGRLKSVAIPNGISYIAPCAFAFCFSLEEAEIPDSVERIGACSFFGCRLSQIAVPSSVSVINRFAFACFAEENAYYIYSGFRMTGQNSAAAARYASEHGLEYRESSFKIDHGVLKQYLGSEPTVVIPDEVTVIGEKAFDGNTDVCRVVIPDSVTAIEDCAFRESGLTEFRIGKHVESIGGAAFGFCKGLRKVDLDSDALRTVGEYAFLGCEELEEFCLPGNLTNITGVSFAVFDILGSGSRLKSIKVDPRNPEFRSIDGILYTRDFKTLIRYPDGKTQATFTVPAHVERVGEEAFSNARYLESVTVPGSTRTIGQAAFEQCTSLKFVQISNGVREIGDSAFSDCHSLKTVKIPRSVKKIGPAAFCDCSELRAVIFEEGIEEIAEYAFDDCKKMKSVTIPSSVMKIGDCAFGTYPGDDLEALMVPDFTICSKQNSAAEQYAADYGINFRALR